MEGVVRTRVGYAGGTAPSPTYQRIGDHSETVEIDYDPSIISYDHLLTEFFASHNAAARSFSTQYRSAVFYRSNAEWSSAESALQLAQSGHGTRLHTSIEPMLRFWMAEEYHQKFRLRGRKEIFAELLLHFTDDRALVDSTSAARLNGWLEGRFDPEQLERELPLTGLSEDALSEVRAYAQRRPRMFAR